MTGTEQVLVEDWCQQYPEPLDRHASSSVRTARCTPAAATARASTSPTRARTAAPLNPCGDPPGGVGAALTPPTAEGGALRSQDLRTSGDPVGLDGTHHPRRPGHRRRRFRTTRWPRRADPNARRIVAYGLRNPFRFTLRPGTNELWIGDVGWNDWEEINRILTRSAGGRRTSAGPATRAPAARPATTRANLNICENLYAPARRGHGAVLRLQPQRAGRAERDAARPAAPRSPASRSIARRQHLSRRVSTARSSSPTTRATASGSMPQGRGRQPGARTDPHLRRRAPRTRCNLEIGPGGDLFYADFDGGTIRRITLHAARTSRRSPWPPPPRPPAPAR